MMTIRVKLRNFAADGGITEILLTPLSGKLLDVKPVSGSSLDVKQVNRIGAGIVLTKGTPARKISVNPIDVKGYRSEYETAVREETLAERLQRMSLGELLYYALIGEGTIRDEPA